MATAGKRYNPMMIHDFLTHLLWIVRSVDFSVATGGTIHPELLEQALPYLEKYGVATLLKMRVLDKRGATPAEIKQAHRLGNAAQRRRFGAYVEHLEALEPLFREALECLKNGDAYRAEKMIHIVTPAEAIAAGGDV